MELPAKNVHDLFWSCMWNKEELDTLSKEELMERSKVVQGVAKTFGFNPYRLQSHRDEVKDLLSQVNPGFWDNSPEKGMLFIELGVVFSTKQLWGEHPTMEMLMGMAIGLGLMKYLMPRTMWALTMGVPMLAIVSEEMSK